MAQAIHQALVMPLDERVNRWKAALAVIRDKDIDWWREAFLTDLRAAARAPA